MSPITRLLIRCAIIFTLIFTGIQIYNRSCTLSHSCRPFYLARYMPRAETGRVVNVVFEATNHRQNLDFEAMQPNLATTTNKMNSVIFHVKNTSKRKLGFRPSLATSPSFFLKYIERLQCPCLEKYLLNPGEEMNLEMEFFIDPKIEREAEFGNFRRNPDSVLKIIYEIE